MKPLAVSQYFSLAQAFTPGSKAVAINFNVNPVHGIPVFPDTVAPKGAK
jgi:hypothetical protein